MWVGLQVWYWCKGSELRCAVRVTIATHVYLFITHLLKLSR